MSAPAMKPRPAPISTTAATSPSSPARATPRQMPLGTPGLMALTGGLSTVSTATGPRFSYSTSPMLPPASALLPPGGTLDREGGGGNACRCQAGGCLASSILAMTPRWTSSGPSAKRTERA